MPWRRRVDRVGGRPTRRHSSRPKVDRRFSAKLTLYDGVSETLETFLARFENFGTHFTWDEEERLFNLRNCLEKAVGNVLWDSGSPTTSTELVALLRSRYGNDNQADHFRMELKTRRRRKGEPLQTEFHDIKRLMALAFSGQTGTMAEIMAIDAFVEYFGDRVLRKQVLQKSLSTLSKALTWAIRIEAIDDSDAPDAPASFDCDGHRKDHFFVHVAAPEGVFSRPSPPNDVRHLELSLQECQTELAR